MRLGKFKNNVLDGWCKSCHRTSPALFYYVEKNKWYEISFKARNVKIQERMNGDETQMTVPYCACSKS